MDDLSVGFTRFSPFAILSDDRIFHNGAPSQFFEMVLSYIVYRTSPLKTSPLLTERSRNREVERNFTVLFIH